MFKEAISTEPLYKSMSPREMFNEMKRGHIEAAKLFIPEHAPKQIREHVDWNTLKKVPLKFFPKWCRKSIGLVYEAYQRGKQVPSLIIHVKWQKLSEEEPLKCLSDYHFAIFESYHRVGYKEIPPLSCILLYDQ